MAWLSSKWCKLMPSSHLFGAKKEIQNCSHSDDAHLTFPRDTNERSLMFESLCRIKRKGCKKQQREKIFPFKMQFAWNVHAKGTICVLICVADVLRGFLQCLQCFGGEQAGRCGLQSISRTRLTCYPVSLSLDVLLIF